MSSFQENIKISKQTHSKHEAKPFWKGIFNPDYIDTQRHYSMLSKMLPVLSSFDVKRTLTIGDNRGRDAAFLKKNLNCYSIASDLSSEHLQKVVEHSFIDEAISVDVENIPLCDDNVDFIVAKESYHHWPRPMMGIYECLRVAKIGLVLIEPLDQPKTPVKIGPFDASIYLDGFEEVGNYKYTLSIREILKTCWAIRLPNVIVKEFNDPYPVLLETKSFDKYLAQEERLSTLAQEGTRNFNLACVCILKQKYNITLDESYKNFALPVDPFAA